MDTATIRSHDPLYGVGGWLSFLCVLLTYVLPALTIVSVASDVLAMDNFEIAFADKVFVIFVDLAVLGFAALGVFAGVKLNDLDKKGVYLARLYFSIGIMYLVGLGMLPALLKSSHNLDWGMIYRSIAPLLWLIYLFVSKRVKLTYDL